MSLIWEMYRGQQIAESRSLSAQGVAAAETATYKADELEWKVEKLTLVNMALIELLVQVAGLTEQQLLEKMHEIDLRDGTEDGRFAQIGVPNCEACGRPYGKHRIKCVYCGHHNAATSVF